MKKKPGGIRRTWRLIKFAVAYALVVFALLTLAKLVDVFARMHDSSPLLAYLCLLALLLPFIYLAVQFILIYLRVPTAAQPPKPELYERSPKKYTKKSLAFARLTVKNLRSNENLTEVDFAVLENAIKQVEKAADREGGLHPMDLQSIWEEHTQPVYAKLDVIAKKKVNKTTLLTAAGTALSQSPLLDGIIQIYQMASLTRKIIKVYWTRPPLVVSLLLARDILSSAGSLILVSKMTESGLIKKGIKSVGNIATKAAQGAGGPIAGAVAGGVTGLIDEAAQAGLTIYLVKRYGKMVRTRCRSIEWNTKMAREEIKEAIEEEAARESADRSKQRVEVFELLRHFSWLRDEQDPEVVVAMVDYVQNKFEQDEERLAGLSQIRLRPEKSNSIFGKAMFWKKKEANTFAHFMSASKASFTEIVRELRGKNITSEEEEFITLLCAESPEPSSVTAPENLSE